MMTIEDFAHRCLLIKAGNAELAIPCCANCEHYKEHPDGGAIYKNGQVVREVALPSWWACHPVNDGEDILFTKPEDFCSRFEERKNNNE